MESACQNLSLFLKLCFKISHKCACNAHMYAHSNGSFFFLQKEQRNDKTT